MANKNPNTSGLIPYAKGQSGNPAGRPRNRAKEALRGYMNPKQLKAATDFTNEEINTIERTLLTADTETLNQIAEAKEIPFYMRALAKAMFCDMKAGRTDTVNRLRERQYGKAVEQIDITSSGQPITQTRVLTPEQAKAVIAELESYY